MLKSLIEEKRNVSEKVFEGLGTFARKEFGVEIVRSEREEGFK